MRGVCFYNFSRTLFPHTSWEGICASMSFLVILIDSSVAPPFLLSCSWIPWQLIICLFWHHLTRVSMDNSVERYLLSLAGPKHINCGGVRIYKSSICVHVCIHVCAHIYTNSCVFGCQSSTSGLSQSFSSLGFWGRVSYWVLRPSTWLDQLDSKLQGSAHL